MLDEPYRFDFRRNRIEVIDLPGVVSPHAAMPLDSDEALPQYLLTLGIKYFAFVRKEVSQELYRLSIWKAASKVPGPAPEIECPLMFRIFDRAEGLARTHRILDGGSRPRREDLK
jgi:hypothetical protein